MDGCDQDFDSACHLDISSGGSVYLTMEPDHGGIEQLRCMQNMVGKDEPDDVKPCLQVDGCKSLTEGSCPIKTGDKVTYKVDIDTSDLIFEDEFVVGNWVMYDEENKPRMG